MPNTKGFDRAFTKLIENVEEEKTKVKKNKDKTVIKYPLQTMKDLTRCTVTLETIEDKLIFLEKFEDKVKTKFTIQQIKNMFANIKEEDKYE